MDNSCAECVDLWKDFAHATIEKIEIAVEEQWATMNGDMRALDKLVPFAVAAANKRVRARRRWVQHQKEHVTADVVAW